jgi:hypothetical protein
MGTIQRVTITLPSDLLAQAREQSQGNLSQFIAGVLREHFEGERRRQLREALIAGAIANAEDDRRIAEEFRFSDYEVTMKYVPPSPDIEVEDAA